MKKLLPLFPFLLAVTLASAKPPAGLQEKLDAFVKGTSGGAAAAWVDSDGVAFFESGAFSAGSSAVEAIHPTSTKKQQTSDTWEGRAVIRNPSSGLEEQAKWKSKTVAGIIATIAVAGQGTS